MAILAVLAVLSDCSDITVSNALLLDGHPGRPK